MRNSALVTLTTLFPELKAGELSQEMSIEPCRATLLPFSIKPPQAVPRSFVKVPVTVPLVILTAVPPGGAVAVQSVKVAFTEKVSVPEVDPLNIRGGEKLAKPLTAPQVTESVDASTELPIERVGLAVLKLVYVVRTSFSVSHARTRHTLFEHAPPAASVPAGDP